jgi:hypothetical protein
MSQSSATEGLYHQQPTTAQLSDYASRQVPGNIIDLGVGQPSPNLLPVDLVREAAAACLGGSGTDSTMPNRDDMDDTRFMLQWVPSQCSWICFLAVLQ